MRSVVAPVPIVQRFCSRILPRNLPPHPDVTVKADQSCDRNTRSVDHDGKHETRGSLRVTPGILRHFYHWGLLLLSSSCYYLIRLPVALASKFGRIVVLPHPDSLDEINSDRADA